MPRYVYYQSPLCYGRCYRGHVLCTSCLGTCIYSSSSAVYVSVYNVPLLSYSPAIFTSVTMCFAKSWSVTHPIMNTFFSFWLFLFFHYIICIKLIISNTTLNSKETATTQVQTKAQAVIACVILFSVRSALYCWYVLCILF